MKKKKSICFFTNSMFRIGGEQRITTLIANGLIKRGYDVTIIIKNKEKTDHNLYDLSPAINLIKLNYKYKFRLNNISLFNFLRTINRKCGLFKNNKKLIRHFYCSNRMLKDLEKIFKSNNFDTVIGVAGDRSYILSYLKEHINSKLIFWNHLDIDSHYKKKNSRYYREEIFINELINKFDEIVVLTNDDKQKLARYYGVNTISIYNSCALSPVEKTNLNNNKFLAVGRLVKQKGFDYLIEAMKEFNKFDNNYTLDIYGDGECKKRLNKLIKKYNLEEKIKIHKPVKNIKQVYLNHDIFLMPSRHEGFGLVTLEALSCGLPVIAFDIPANKEIIQENINGLLVKAYDTKKFSEAMLHMTQKHALCKKIQNNIPSTLDKFSEEKILDKWESII